LGAFICPRRGQINRAFRSKSSEAPMRFLWAFRYNPSRKRQLRTGIFTAKSKKLNKFLILLLLFDFFDSPLGVGSAYAGLKASVHACSFRPPPGVVPRLRRAGMYHLNFLRLRGFSLSSSMFFYFA
jgi:hypothetical protein